VIHTVAIVFLDLRGYRCARIRAAAEEGRRRGGGQVLAVQVTGAAAAEGDFAWRVEETGGAGRRPLRTPSWPVRMMGLMGRTCGF